MSLQTKISAFLLLMFFPAAGWAGGLKVDPKISWLEKNLESVGARVPQFFFAPPDLSRAGPEESGRIAVFIFYRERDRALNEILINGGRIRKITPRLIAAELGFEAISGISGSDAVSFITPARPLTPELDVAVPLIGGDRVHQGLDTGGTSYRGKNVIAGIVDTGIDLSHPDFHHPDGSTRIIWLWDQTQPEGSRPEGFDYGRECDANLINRDGCGEEDGLYIDETLAMGHGTHVAGIAAGSDPTYTGVAPEALIIAVKAKMDELSLIDGVDYLLGKASDLGLPAVINISLGTNEGAHDGSSPMEIELAGRARPGTIFVVSAGNEAADTGGKNLIHLGGSATGEPAYSRLSMNTVDLGGIPIILELWYDPPAPGDFLGIALAAEQTDHQEIVDQTEFSSADTDTVESELRDGTQAIARVAIYSPREINPVNAARQALVTISPPDTGSLFSGLRNYDWALVTRAQAGGDPIPFDAWINSENAVFSAFSGPGPENASVPSLNYIGGDDKKSLVIPATARGVFSVGSFVSRIEWPDLGGKTMRQPGIEAGQVSDFSSRGPTRDGRLKPEFVAPGEMIASAFSSRVSSLSDLMVDDYHSVISGSSLAAPFVSGAVALMLERSPGLDFSQAFSLLSRHAILDDYTGPEPNPNAGYGKLNLAGVFNDPGFPETRIPDTIPPVISEVKVEEGETFITVVWKTDELSSSLLKLRRKGDSAPVDIGTMSFTREHRVEATELLSDTGYIFQILSRDPSGNQSLGFERESKTKGTGGCGCSSAGQDAAPISLIYVLLGLLVTWTLRARSKAQAKKAGSKGHRA